MSTSILTEHRLRQTTRTFWKPQRLVRLTSLFAFLGILTYFSLAAPLFLSYANVLNVFQQSAVLGVLAFGMTTVFISGGANVISGGIDLSIASNLGLSAAVYASVIQAGGTDLAALPLTFLTGLGVGVANAWAIVGLRIFPLLATLATMNICAGCELVLTQNTVVPAASPLLGSVAATGAFAIPNIVYVFLCLAAFLMVLIEATPFGLRLYAVGSFREAAVAAGIQVNRYVVSSYLISGFCASVAAILSLSLLNGSSPGAGEMLLSIVLIALLGVIVSRRGVPTISGTLVSSLFLGFLVNGFQLTNVSSYWINGVQGVLILLVVAGTSFSRRAGY
jgi:ribose transport system permease protein